MSNALPPEVALLLQSADEANRDAAWAQFVANHSRLLLHTTRTVVRDRDRAMDAYAWVLERLAENGARRLRGFRADGPGRFTTWLVVIARRLSVDFLRHEGGRTRPRGGTGHGGGMDPRLDGHVFRLRLLELAGDPVDLAALGDSRPGADVEVEASERHEALRTALEGLPPLDRLLLTLRFEDGLEAEQIARTMHFPTRFHVYRRLNRVLGDLRTRLTERGIDGET